MGISEKYKYKLKGEDVREHPDSKEKIQVRCRNHECNLSKENDGWFTPTEKQINDRIKDIEEEKYEVFFFCSKSCREESVFEKIKNDPKRTLDKPFTDEEEKEWEKKVLENDGHKCQLCDNRDQINVYRIFPIKDFPHLALDPSFSVTLCGYHRFRMKSLQRLRKFKESQLYKENK